MSSLICLDEQGCKIPLEKFVLTIHDDKGRFLTKIKQSSGLLYLLELNIDENCLQTHEDTTWEWHKRYGHLNFVSLKL